MRVLTVMIAILSTAFAGVAQQNPPFRVGVGVAEPRLTGPDAQCTDSARRDRIKGIIVLSATETTAGKLENIRVTRPLRKDLDIEAVKTVRRWKGKPAMKDGKPVREHITIEMNFDCCVLCL